MQTGASGRSGQEEVRGRRLAWRAWVVAALVVSDAFAMLVGTSMASLVRFGRLTAQVGFENSTIEVTFLQASVLVGAIWLAFLAMERLYDLERLFWGAGEFTRVVRALSMGVVAVVLLTYLLKTPGLSRLWIVTAWAACVATVMAGRLVVRIVLNRLRRRGGLAERTLVVGSNAEAADIIRILLAHPESGLLPVGCMASSQAERLDLDYCSDKLPVLGYARELKDAIIPNDIDAVVIASSAFEHDILARIIAELRGLEVTIHLSSGLFEVLTSRVFVREVGGVPLIGVKGVSLATRKVLTKRVFDILVAGGLVLFGLPVWLAIMAAIKSSSRGPVFYSQTRVGRDGHEFGMLKFRSMVADADARRAELAEENEASGPIFKMRDDPRVTPVGKWLRKYSIDEFPQLINVLRGEMSLAGPRPPLPREVLEYSAYHWRRLEVVPGMTGLWQVSGRSELTFEDMVRLDLFYIENWSLGLDMSILLRTVPTVLGAKGAY